MGRTFQQWVSSQRAEGHAAEDIQAAFKERYGDDLTTLDADADYDAYKASKPARRIRAAPTDIAAAAAPLAAAAESLAPGATGLAPKPAPPRTRVAGIVPVQVADRGIVPPEPYETRTAPQPEAVDLPAEADVRAPTSPKPPVRDMRVQSNLLANVFGGGLLDVSKKTREGGGETSGLLGGLARPFRDLPSPEEVTDRELSLLPGETDAEGKPLADKYTGLGGPMPGVSTQAGEMAKLRKERALDSDSTAENVGRGLKNVGVDIMDNIGGLLNLANELVGVSMVPKERDQAEYMAQFGQTLVEGGLGGTADLARGMFSLEGDNSWQTAPLSTWMSLVEPTLNTAKRSPVMAGKVAQIQDGFREIVVKPMVEQGVDRALGMGDREIGQVRREGIDRVADETAAAVKRILVNGIMQADPRATGMVEGLVHGREEAVAQLQNAVERIARQEERTGIQTVKPTLSQVPLSVVPSGVAREAAVAEKAIGKAQAEAGRVGGVADAARATADETKALDRGVGRAQAVAEKAEGRIADIAERDLAGPRLPSRERARNATLAQQGIKTAEAARALDAAPAAGMAREVATLAGREAKRAERAAGRTAADLEGAGERGQVFVGDVFVPQERAIPGASVTAMEPGASQYGQQQQLRDLFPDADDAAIADLSQAVADASALREQAVDAGFPVDAPMPPPVARLDPSQTVGAGVEGSPLQQAQARWNMAPDATLYDVARRAAEDFKDRAVGKGEDGGIQGRLAAELRLMGVPDRAADLGAQWLLREVDARDQGKRLEVSAGVIRRPPAEVMRFEVQPDGSLLQMPESHRLASRIADEDTRAYADPLATEPGTSQLPPPGAERRALQESREMVDRRVEQEAPKPYRTTNAVVEQSLDEVAKVMREFGYYADMTVPDTQVATKPMAVGELPPSEFATVRDQHIKRLTRERIAQRLLDPLDVDSTQLMQVPEVRNAALKVIEQNARAAGLSPVQRARLKANIAQQLTDPKRASSMSKSRFVEVYIGDKPIWTRADYAKLYDSLPEKAVKKARAQRIREIGESMAEAVNAYGALQDYHHEINRFRRTPDGQTIEATLGDVKNYAKEVARRVLGEGELEPQMMPFSGDEVSAALRTNAEKWAAEFGTSVPRIEQLANRLRAHKPIANSMLEKQWNQMWRESFRGTGDDSTPPSFANVYVKPSVAASLRADLFMRTSGAGLWGPLGLATAIANRAKAGVVAENLKTLINNDLSNIAVDIINEASPLATVGDAVVVPAQVKAFMDGDTSRLSPEHALRARALADAGIVQTSKLSRDIGKSKFWQTFGDTFSGATKTLEAADAATSGKLAWGPRKAAGIAEFQQDMYSTLGDVPFRLAKAARVYDHLGQMLTAMEPGKTIEVPVATARKVAVEAMGNGQFRVTDISGPRAKGGQIVGANSLELARIKALAGKVAQEKLYFDYGRIGNWGKYLRGGGPLSLVSGIFSWFFKATDIPGIKRGLLTEALAGPPQYATTSPAVRAMQAEARNVLAYKRAALTAAIQAGMDDPEKQRELRRVFAFNPELESVFVAAATDPRRMNVRDVSTTMWGTPTTTMLGGIERIANAVAFGSLTSNPEALAAMLKPDKQSLVEAAANEDDPALAMAKLAAMGPAAAMAAIAETKDRQRRSREHLYRYAMGRDFNERRAIDLVGLGGGPLLGMIWRMKDAGRAGKKYGYADAARDFGKMMFGANAAAMFNVGMAALGEAGVDGAGRWSTYRDKQMRQGFRAGELDEDETSLVRFMWRDLLGVGWSEILFKGAENDATGGKLRGRLKTYIGDAKGSIKQTLMKAAEQDIKDGKPGAKRIARQIEKVIDRDSKQLEKNIDKTFRAVRAEATPDVMTEAEKVRTPTVANPPPPR